MTNIIFSSVIKGLNEATTDPEHPFRYFALATLNLSYTPTMRTVVLREVDEMLKLTIYTDKRSEKITHIKTYNSTSLLFFDPKKFIQITIEAKAKIIETPEKIQSLWENVPLRSRRAYTTKLSPGQEIIDPEVIDYLEDTHFFSAIEFTPYRIEYLKLLRPNHIRVRFEKENEEWKSNFIVP